MKHLITALVLCWFCIVPAATSQPPTLDSELRGLPPQLWEEIQKLSSSDAATNDFFGISASISKNTVVIGARLDDDACPANPSCNSGSAYIFERHEGGTDNWGEVTKITASDAAMSDFFGHSVSTSGNTVVVGAYGNDDVSSASGSAYIFERNEGGTDNWGEVTKITASDTAGGDEFGFSVTISGDTVVVGAPGDDDAGNGSGSAYIFERNEGGAENWGEVTKIAASDAAESDLLGFSVSISENTVVVGAQGDDDAGNASGSAYIFERNEGGADNWGEATKITASNGDSNDFFGESVSINEDTVVVGASRDDDAGTDSGSAFIFERNEGGADNWGEVAKITASDGDSNDFFGFPVATSGDTVVVGAHLDDGVGIDSGSAYIFERDLGGADNWGEVTKITASDATSDERFGTSVSVSGNTAVVSARFGDGASTDSGSAYIFEDTLSRIFSDGFESGTTSAWSSVVPGTAGQMGNRSDRARG